VDIFWHTLSKSVGLGPAYFKVVCNLGCPSRVVYVERLRT